MFTLRLNKLIFVPTMIICLLTFLSMLNRSIITKELKKKVKIKTWHFQWTPWNVPAQKINEALLCFHVVTPSVVHLLWMFSCFAALKQLICLSSWDLAASERGREGGKREHPVPENCRWTVELHSFSQYFYCIAYVVMMWFGYIYSIKKTCSLISLW